MGGRRGHWTRCDGHHRGVLRAAGGHRPVAGSGPCRRRARWRGHVADREVGGRAGCAVQRRRSHRASCDIWAGGNRVGQRRGGKRSAGARAIGASCTRRRVEARIRGSRCFAPRAVPSGARAPCSTIDARWAGGRRRRRVRCSFRCFAVGSGRGRLPGRHPRCRPRLVVPLRNRVRLRPRTRPRTSRRCTRARGRGSPSAGAVSGRHRGDSRGGRRPRRVGDVLPAG